MITIIIIIIISPLQSKELLYNKNACNFLHLTLLSTVTFAFAPRVQWKHYFWCNKGPLHEWAISQPPPGPEQLTVFIWHLPFNLFGMGDHTRRIQLKPT